MIYVALVSVLLILVLGPILVMALMQKDDTK